MQIHAPKRYSCATCSASFGLLRGLTRHEKACQKRIVCTTCHVAFSTQEDLKWHCELSQHEEFVLFVTGIDKYLVYVLYCNRHGLKILYILS